MNTPTFFFALGVFAVLWYELGLVGVIFLASHAHHPVRIMERICEIATSCKPRGWFTFIVLMGLIAALLGPAMLGLAFLAKPRKRSNEFLKAVLK